MPNVTLYHNPRCSKSRQTLSLLQEKGIEPTVIEYLQTPPSEQEITKLLHMLELKPRELMRKKEEVYKTLELNNESLSEAELIKAMAENPILIERPIVVANNKAAIGRPPEAVLEIV